MVIERPYFTEGKEELYKNQHRVGIGEEKETEEAQRTSIVETIDAEISGIEKIWP